MFTQVIKSGDSEIPGTSDDPNISWTTGNIDFFQCFKDI